MPAITDRGRMVRDRLEYLARTNGINLDYEFDGMAQFFRPQAEEGGWGAGSRIPLTLAREACELGGNSVSLALEPIAIPANERNTIRAVRELMPRFGRRVCEAPADGVVEFTFAEPLSPSNEQLLSFMQELNQKLPGKVNVPLLIYMVN